MEKIKGRKKNTNKKPVDRLTVAIDHEDYLLLRKALEEGKLVSISSLVRKSIKDFLMQA